MPFLVNTFNKDDWNGGYVFNTFTVQTGKELIQLLDTYQKARGFSETIKFTCGCNIHFIPFFGSSKECIDMMKKELKEKISSKLLSKISKQINTENSKLTTQDMKTNIFDSLNYFQLKDIYDEFILNLTFALEEEIKQKELLWESLKEEYEKNDEKYENLCILEKDIEKDIENELNNNNIEQNKKYLSEVQKLMSNIIEKTSEMLKYELIDLKEKRDESKLVTRHLISVDDIKNNIFPDVCLKCGKKCSEQIVEDEDGYDSDYTINIFEESNFSKI